jgi:hypothetical protein
MIIQKIAILMLLFGSFFLNLSIAGEILNCSPESVMLHNPSPYGSTFPIANTFIRGAEAKRQFESMPNASESLKKDIFNRLVLIEKKSTEKRIDYGIWKYLRYSVCSSPVGLEVICQDFCTAAHNYDLPGE